MTEPLFEIVDLSVATPTVDDGGRGAGATGNGAGIPLLDGVSLSIRPGEVHALMGPDGSGKSTLAAALLGSPAYEVTGGRILFKGDDITHWATDVRAKAGVFLAFQYPEEIAGVSVLNLLRQALSARRGIEMSVVDLRASLTAWMNRLGIDASFIERHVNEGFSGEEKKRNELLQMAVLEPEVAILDETDSGLDLPALEAVANGVQAIRAERPRLAVLVITHDRRLPDHLEPDRVHVLLDGGIAASGGPELVRQLERDGYESFR